jgi:hypothetical protein
MGASKRLARSLRLKREMNGGHIAMALASVLSCSIGTSATKESEDIQDGVEPVFASAFVPLQRSVKRDVEPDLLEKDQKKSEWAGD